ncbi:hypothetical protein BABINDRAFT_84916 [Babjeviella inositovora NRRL Y-12698]|uniref:Uncharacterized protein n=1 Tax=Babjeviella inositovora NRRL Y-12698 TaxID=984486 RepID=A0A1E3QLA5_9ASCO|nr:uncharacterized protein BABINDRAFT_84916 [Babjeviella inositovora NRRL Y-12698]ODQ78476.1 hypothetical protein BABINDRAFT_84916 [Babjeviella inositovora NRRL Y-12698]
MPPTVFIRATLASDCTNLQECEKPTSIPAWGIAITVIVPVLLFVAIIGAFIYRNYRKNQQEAAFDNDPEFDGDGTILPDYPRDGPYMREMSVQPQVKSQSDVYLNPFESGAHNMNHMYANNNGLYSDPMRSVRHSTQDAVSILSHTQISANPFVLPYSGQTGSKHSLDEYARNIGAENPAYNVVKSSSQLSLAHPSQPYSKRNSSFSTLSKNLTLNGIENGVEGYGDGRYDESEARHDASDATSERSDVEATSDRYDTSDNHLLEGQAGQSKLSITTNLIDFKDARSGSDVTRDVRSGGYVQSSDELDTATLEETHEYGLNTDNRQSFAVNDESKFEIDELSAFPEGDRDSMSHRNSDTAATTARGSLLDGDDYKHAGSRLDLVNQVKDDLSAKEEEELQRMKSVYKVYFERGNLMKSVGPADELFNKYEEEGMVPPLPQMQDHAYLTVEHDAKRNTVASSVYSMMEEGYAPAQHPFQKFNPQIHQQYAENRRYAENQGYPQGQYQQQPRGYPSEQAPVPENLPSLQLLPTPADFRKSTLETFTNFLPKERTGSAKPKLGLQPFNPIEHANVWSPVSPSVSEFPLTMSMTSGTNPMSEKTLPNPAQLARTSIVMMNSAEFGQRKAHKPAGAVSTMRAPLTPVMDGNGSAYFPSPEQPVDSMSGQVGIPSTGNDSDLRKALGSNRDYQF